MTKLITQFDESLIRWAPTGFPALKMIPNCRYLDDKNLPIRHKCLQYLQDIQEVAMRSRFNYVYVLQSLKDGCFYTGFTTDLRQRLLAHAEGKVKATQRRLPVELVYYEACQCQSDATQREKYLKSAWGKRYLKNRIKNYLAKLEPPTAFTP